MIAFKSIGTITPTKHGLFHKGGPSKRKNFILFSKSNVSDSAAPPPERDTQKQELLARIAMLQTQKIMGNIESRMQAFEESAESNKLALVSLLSIGIVNSLISSSDYRKALVLGLLLIGVLSQVIYEQSIISETEQTQEAETKEDKSL